MRKKKRIERIRRGEEGWTFIETVIVLAITLTLSSTAGFVGFQYIARARIVAAQSQIETICLALSGYLFDCGLFPSQEQGLEALWSCPSTSPVPENWNGPYLEKLIGPDPWGNMYRYFLPGPHGLPYGLVSYGEDGREGGEGRAGDIASWE